MTSRTIGELADAAGVGIETIRYYERRGLLTEPARSASGYRQFDDEALTRLRFIQRAKTLGFTLREITELLGEVPASPDDMIAAARARLHEVDEQLTTLAEIHDRLRALVATCTAATSSDDPDAITDCLTLS